VHFVDAVVDACDARDLLAIEPRRNRIDQPRSDKRLLRVRLEDSRINELPGDVQKRRGIDTVARLQHWRAAAAARIE
jgi:hypothetical protein